MQSAQDRRLARQRTLGQLRLQGSEADHRLQLAEERVESRRAVAAEARRSETEARALLDAATALRTQLASELGEAEQAIDPATEIPPAPAEPDASAAHEAQRTAEHARRAAAVAASSVAGLRTRRRAGLR